jgi:hypothetical protein
MNVRVQFICYICFNLSVLLQAFSMDEIIITHKQVRQDEFTISSREVPWAEGWGEMQFFPRFYQPACTLHLFLANTSAKEITVSGLLYNGRDIAEVCTRPDFAGPVIWHRVNPDTIPPGGTAMVYVRLRRMLTEKVTLGVRLDDGRVVSAELGGNDVSKIRIASTGFDLAKKKLYVYIEKHAPEPLSLSGCTIDGQTVAAADLTMVNQDFDMGQPAFMEINLEKPISFGQNMVLLAQCRQGASTAYQIKVLDSRFDLGVVYGKADRYPLYRKYFFNTCYILGTAKDSIPEDFWKGAGENDITVVRTASRREDVERVIAQAPPEQFVFGTIDEPDGNDYFRYPKVSLMERCGINIMAVIEPILAR